MVTDVSLYWGQVMIIGIEFEVTKWANRTYFRVAPYITGLQPRTVKNIKAVLLGTFLMGTVVAIGKVFEQ